MNTGDAKVEHWRSTAVRQYQHATPSGSLGPRSNAPPHSTAASASAASAASATATSAASASATSAASAS